MPEDLGAGDTSSTAIAGEITTAEIHVPAQKRRWLRRVWRWAKLWGKRAFALSTTLTTVLLAGWIVWLVGEAIVRKGSLDIEPIGVSKKLADDGFSSEVVTQRLRDAIKAVLHRATTTMAKNRVDIPQRMPDVTIPKAGVSVESVAASFRYLLPDSWQHKISGEFISSRATLSIRLRLNGSVVFSDETTDPDGVDALIKKAAFCLIKKTQPFVAASSLFATRDYSGATTLANEIIASLPPEDESVMRAYNLKGLIAERQDDKAKAEVFYLTFPNSPISRTNLGGLYRDQQKLEKAISEYRLAIQLDPNSAPPHEGLGNVLSDQGKLDEAIIEYRRAIQLDPKDAPPHDGLGNVLSDQGKRDEAISEELWPEVGDGVTG